MLILVSKQRGVFVLAELLLLHAQNLISKGFLQLGCHSVEIIGFESGFSLFFCSFLWGQGGSN